MPAHSYRPRRATTPPPDLLAAIAETVHEGFQHLMVDDPAHLLRVVGSCDAQEEIELGLLPLSAGQHPADAMAGFTAPTSWWAVGVVTAGRSHELVEAHHIGCAEPTPRPVRLTFLLARSGAACTRLTPIGGAQAQHLTLQEPPHGVLADACRRTLGLATAPPADGPEVWLTARWLDRLLATAIEQPGAVPTWDAAVRHHPLVPRGVAPPPEAVLALVDEACSEFDWERLRLMATRSRGADPAVSPAVAAWMDAGSFARHVLAAELPIDLLLTELDALIPPAVIRAIHQSLPGPARRTVR